MASAGGGSAFVESGSGGPVFAGLREPVEYATPARLAALREGERIKQTVARLSERLQRLRAQNADQAELDKVEAAFSRAVEAWSEFVVVEDAAEPVPDSGGYISLSELLRMDLDSGEELSRAEQDFRAADFRALLRFVFQDGSRQIGQAFKNFLAVVRRVSPVTLDGMNKADLALLLGETRAATCAREIRVVEKYLKEQGARGYRLLGGQKNEETRKRCARSARGNQSRRNAGQKRKS